MPPAARIGDPTDHPGAIAAPGAPMVLIGGQPAAVAQMSLHSCAMAPPAGPHPPAPFPSGSATVLIGGQPALRSGDRAGCGAAITTGAPTVLIGG
jgi:uncharacterized Zn-binding protein involved in type VI secretion